MSTNGRASQSGGDQAVGGAAVPPADGGPSAPNGGADARPTQYSDDELAISVRNVGKRYDIFTSTRDRAKHAIAKGLGLIDDEGMTPWGTGAGARPFWAIRNINFDVPRGSAIGIIGRNGSGKSTLMQIIAGTLTPTEGEVRIRGRVAALLELGSGFNPQFTGRENVFLAGAILGINRAEMERRFDAIAAFADIGDFLEQPVELYSSGMHARLAFSVASSIEPDILVLDEILAVGDVGFQQKCLGRLRSLTESGVTLLLVSHSPDVVKSICQQGLLLHKGQAEFFGPAAPAVDAYVQSLRLEASARALATGTPDTFEILTDAAELGLLDEKGESVADSLKAESGGQAENTAIWTGRYGTGHARAIEVLLLDRHGMPSEAFRFSEEITVRIVVEARANIPFPDVACIVRDSTGIDIFGASAFEEGARLSSMRPGDKAVVEMTFTCNLRPGPHGVTVAVTSRRDPENPGSTPNGIVILDHRDACAAFECLLDRPIRVVRGKVQEPVRVRVQAEPATEPAAVGEPSRL